MILPSDIFECARKYYPVHYAFLVISGIKVTTFKGQFCFPCFAEVFLILRPENQKKNCITRKKAIPFDNQIKRKIHYFIFNKIIECCFSIPVEKYQQLYYIITETFVDNFGIDNTRKYRLIWEFYAFKVQKQKGVFWVVTAEGLYHCSQSDLPTLCLVSVKIVFNQ